MESGVSNFVFKEEQRGWAAEMARLGRFKPLFYSQKGAVIEEDGSEVARVHAVAGET